MKRGDIVFIRGKGLKSKLTRLIDRGAFSHVAIAISDSKIIESDVGTRVSVREFSPKEYDYVEVVDLRITIKQRQDVYNSAVQMIGTKYDYVQLIWYGLRRIFGLKGNNRLNNPKNVICSEMVFIALSRAGILKSLGIEETNFRGIDLTPNELYDLVKYVSKK
ncbi:YiiX/YebB-like N1pC/P60 family cysteine hydrolase [Peribacillus asahii]|uniref:YiiX/YebB-like N1pC/P60 family cysteine hydrolase n=1 Tax=Peribacillus asahii TaxID=228899 RepID=UPI0037FCC70C